MKKIIRPVIALLIILCVTAALFLIKPNLGSKPVDGNNESSIGIFTIQYRIYAPPYCLVTLDDEKVEYNDTIKCYAAELKKGKHTLTVSKDGCEAVKKEINANSNSSEIKLELNYTADFIDEGEKTAQELLERLFNKCWSLDCDLSEFNFYTEADKDKVENTVSGIISSLEDNLSAEYSVGDPTISLTPVSSDTDKSLCRYDSDSNALVYPFNIEYSYTWSFKSDTYKNSGQVKKDHTAHLTIEKIDGEWYIRNLYLQISNGEY